MPYTYPEAFARLADSLGFARDPIRPLVHVRHPLRLRNRTLPVVESLMVGGAGLALARAFGRWRGHDDPTHLAVWLGSVAYLLVTEPPLYFPKVFHLPDAVADVFVHNVFTVQFLYEHLPLYIVALYPAMAGLAYDLVQSLGGFDSGALLGAVSVGFVHHLFYEIFDQLGPQLSWWSWNPDAESNEPAVASVPLTSAFLFATVGPAAISLLTRLLVGRRAERGEPIGGWALGGRSLAVGAGVPALIAAAGLPPSVLGSERCGVQRMVLSGLIGVTGAVAAPTLARGWRRTRATRSSATGDTPWYGVGFGGLYLAVFGLLWRGALPGRLAAEDGVTPEGTPAGSLAYALGCAGLAAATVAGAATARGRDTGRADAGQRWPGSRARIVRALGGRWAAAAGAARVNRARAQP